jgi:hypothetical protein
MGLKPVTIKAMLVHHKAQLVTAQVEERRRKDPEKAKKLWEEQGVLRGKFR